MTVREILKMGDPRLLRIAQPVTAFDTDALHLLVTDMLDTMRAAQGAGLAAPQIGVDLQLVIFGGFERNLRYPDRPVVPPTVLINPTITPLSNTEEQTGKVVSPYRACGAKCRVGPTSTIVAWTLTGKPLTEQYMVSTPAWCSTSATTCGASCTPCACATSANLVLPKCCFLA